MISESKDLYLGRQQKNFPYKKRLKFRWEDCVKKDIKTIRPEIKWKICIQRYGLKSQNQKEEEEEYLIKI